MDDNLHIRLLGGFRVDYHGAPVKGLERSRLQSLFAYLVLHPNTAYTRTHLAFHFWPDSTEAQALTNLRKHLHFLRQTIPNVDRYIYVDAKSLSWQTESSYSLDVLEFENAIADADRAEQRSDQARLRACLERAEVIYQGDLLPDLYDDWIMPEREHLHQQFTRALERLVVLLEEQRDYESAENYAHRLLRYNPVNESTYRQLMRIYALQGERASALRTYHTCATVLRRELGVDPSSATQDVYQQLLGEEIEVNSVREVLVGTTPLVGRHLEWSQLRKSWFNTRNQSPQFILLRGEAGIGKTRMAEEMLNWASRQGIQVAYACCHESGADLAYAPLVTWLRTNPLPQKWSSLESVWLKELSHLLPDIIALHQNIPYPSEYNQDWGKQRLFEALLRALLACRQVLLILDDIHWCDSGTLDWLSYVFTKQPYQYASWDKVQILVVATMRNEAVDGVDQVKPLLGDLHRLRRIIEIELNPLTEDETAVLAKNIAGHDLTSLYLSKLYQDTEGNPLFVVETQRAGFNQQLPQRVKQVLKARLEHLSPESRRLAGWAAIIGRDFTYDLLAKSTQENEATLINALDELWRYRIIQEQQEGGYEFTHPLIGNTALDLLSPVKQRFAHRQIAKVLEEELTLTTSWQEHPTSQASERPRRDIQVQIASHYEMAGQPEKSIVYYRQAADSALQLYATQQAIDLYRRGLEAVADTEIDKPDMPALLSERMRLLEGLGRALELVGDHVQARQFLQKALECLSGRDSLNSSRLMHFIGDTYKSQGDYLKAAEAYDQAEAALNQASDQDAAEARRLWLEIQFSRIYMYYGHGNTEEMLRMGEQLTEYIEASGTPSQRAKFYLANSAMRCRRARYVIDAATIEFANKAFQTHLDTGDLYGISEARFGLGFVRLWHGDLTQAEEDLRNCLDEANQMGNESLAVLCLAYLSTIYRIQHSTEQCKDFSFRCLEKAENLSMQTYAGLAQANLAWQAWKTGDIQNAWERAQIALVAWRSSVFPFQWTARFIMITIALDRGDTPDVIASCKELLDASQQILPVTVNTLLLEAIAEWDRGNMRQAIDKLNLLVAAIKILNYL